MVTFFGASAIFTVGALVLGTPLFFIARRMGRDDLRRRFVLGAVFVGMLCGMIAASSARLVRQCQEAGNPDCNDYGASGLQFMFVAAYALVAWLNAFLLNRD